MACDPNELIQEAVCFQCLDETQQHMAMIALLCEISQGGGGGGSISVEEDGSEVVNPATILNFTGSGVTVTDAGGGQADIAIAGGGSGVDVEDEGVPVATATVLNFIGAGVTATDAGGGQVDVTIPGGGAGSTNIFTNAGDPNGVVNATGPAICMDTVNEKMWWKTTAGTSGVEWY